MFSFKFSIARENMRQAIAAGTEKAMQRAGDRVAESAKKRLKVRKQVSRPGEPPAIHSADSPLRKIEAEKTHAAPVRVFVGPIELHNRRFGTLGKKSVPELLEMGGSAPRVRMRDGGSERFGRVSDLRMRLLQRSGRLAGVARELAPREDDALRSAVARYQARPLMRPTLEREAKSGGILAEFKDCVGE